MKLAIIGSRSLERADFKKYLPNNISEIVSGGAIGIDTLAQKYAEKHKIKFTVFLPEYEKYGRSAPLRRNIQIIDYADEVIAFWDGESRGTKFVIDHCRKNGKKIRVILDNELLNKIFADDKKRRFFKRK